MVIISRTKKASICGKRDFPSYLYGTTQHERVAYCMSPPYLYPSQQIVCVTCVVVVVGGGERERKLLALGGGEEGKHDKNGAGKAKERKS